ncbi:MAG: SusC/RagA family TonB-linked outer membrane protein [Prolixibacteraceae bacterium]|nr:SusC/RagA family TonB-linked outer membrane protein [Prolixibacteraceae bacterium]
MKNNNNCESFIPLKQCGFRTFKLLTISILLLLIVFSANLVSAKVAKSSINNLNSVQPEQQKKTIKGIVTDENGEVIPGVSVLVKGTTVGTITNFNGAYSLEVPADARIVTFSFVGMKSQDTDIAGRTEINITLVSETIGVDEVVVTALGIQRDKKTLTYSSQQVSGDEMLKSKDINFMSSLSGKSAGLEIRKSVSGAGGSTRTVLRGSKSLSQLSEPLYVIDGIPMVNRKGAQSSVYGGTDEGDGLSQINPEDIESISILKGSNAAVLYGSQGANGVVIITTKKGKEGKTNISFSSSTIMESVIATPNLQFNYGSDGGARESWSYTKGNYASNYVKDFFQTGTNLVNTVAISGGNDKTTAYFSYGNTSATGVIENNKYQKNNITFQQSTKLFDNKLTIHSNVMLTSEKAENRNTAGYYLNPLIGLYLFPRDKDFDSYKINYQVFNADRNMFLQNWVTTEDKQSNPFWIINKQPKTDLTKRVIASVSADYDISKKLKFQIRASYDYAEKSYEQKYFAGGNTTNIGANGSWSYKKYNDMLMYTDGIFTYQDKFGDISLNGIIGASYQKAVYGDGVNVNTDTKGLIFPNEFYFQNIPTNVQVQSTYDGKIIKEGVFGNAQIGYKEMLFLDLSGRNDWASTLAGTGNDSYFYPSFGLTGILSQMINMPSFISFSKVRVSNATVANEVPFNKITPSNSISSIGSVIRNTQSPFTDAKPEMLRTWEFGTDWRFFKGRLGLDFTYYNIKSTNQYLTYTPTASQNVGNYTTFFTNAGEIVNKGVEVVINAVPVKVKDFEWSSSINFSKNKNTVVELLKGEPDKYIDFGSAEGYTSRIYTGGSFGDLYGYKFLRNASGQIMLDEKTGAPLKTTEIEYLGNLEPKFSLGWNNSFIFKQFSLNFLINAKIGGKCFSQTESILDGYGVSKRTADARNNGGVVIDAIKGTTPVSMIDTKLYYSTVGDRNGISEAYVFDRTNVRLAQLAFGYNFDVNKLKLPIKAASFSIVGNNLFFLYKKTPFDPELTMRTDMNSQSFDAFNLPATRSYGFNLKFTF